MSSDLVFLISKLNFSVVRNNWFVQLSLALFFGAFTSCEIEKQSAPVVEIVQEAIEPIVYEEFTPDSSNMESTPEIDVNAAFELDAFTIVSAYDRLSYNEGAIEQDTVNGWGDRLFLFNNKNEIIYQSKGVGELYVYHPYFYRNAVNRKVFIICQMGNEFWFGGDLFLYENGTIKYVGNIDVEGADMETSLIDIINIQETKNETIFTFNRDSVALHPGGDIEIVPSKGLSYVYKNDRFKLTRE